MSCHFIFSKLFYSVANLFCCYVMLLFGFCRFNNLNNSLTFRYTWILEEMFVRQPTFDCTFFLQGNKSFMYKLAAASLVSRNIWRDMKGQKNSLKPCKNSFINMKQPKTIPGPIKSFILKENQIGSSVSEILCYRLKLLYIIICGFVGLLFKGKAESPFLYLFLLFVCSVREWYYQKENILTL